MEHTHTYHEEWQGADEHEEVVPEMGSYHLASFCDIGCYHTRYDDRNAIEGENAPIWQGCL